MNSRVNGKRTKNAEGQYLCKVCRAVLPKRRTAYCSDECFHRNTPSIMRAKVYRRDNGVCALCHVDTKTLPSRRGAWSAIHQWEADHIVPVSEGGGLCGLDGYRTLCIACHGKESGKLRKRLNAHREIEKAQRKTGRLF